MIVIESTLIQESRVSHAIERFKGQNPERIKKIKVLKPDVIINLIEDGQPEKFTFIIGNFQGDLFRRLEQCQGSVILGKKILILGQES